MAPADANFTGTDCWQPWCASSRSSGDLSFPESTGNVLWCHQSVWTGFSMPLVLSKASETPRGCVEGRRDSAGRGATCVPGQGIPILLVPCVNKKKKQKTTDGNCERQVPDSCKGLGAVGAWGVLITKGGGAGGALVTCWVPGWLDGDAGGGHVEIDVARVCAVGR